MITNLGHSSYAKSIFIQVLHSILQYFISKIVVYEKIYN